MVAHGNFYPAAEALGGGNLVGVVHLKLPKLLAAAAVDRVDVALANPQLEIVAVGGFARAEPSAKLLGGAAGLPTFQPIQAEFRFVQLLRQRADSFPRLLDVRGVALVVRRVGGFGVDL